MRALLTSAFMVAAGATTFVTALLRRIALQLAHDSAMMAAMAIGMVAGLSAGAAAGLLFPEDLWPPTVVGSLAGMGAGLAVGVRIGVMGVLEGVMAGLMGGTMGAMMAFMMPGRGVPLVLAAIFVTALVAGLTVRLLTEHQGNGGHHGGHGGHGSHRVAWTTPLWWTALALMASGVAAWISLGALAHRLPVGGVHHRHGAPPTVTVTARELAFSPAVVEVRAGQTVRLQFLNQGTQEHDLNIEGLEYQAVGRQDLRAGPSGFHLYAAPGGQVAAEFVPLRPGEYEVYCSVPGHREAGMKILLRVLAQS